MEPSLEQAIQQVIAGINQKYVQQVPLQQKIAQFLEAQKRAQFNPYGVRFSSGNEIPLTTTIGNQQPTILQGYPVTEL